MKNLTKENIENIAMKVASNIFVTAVAFTKDNWITELEAISNHKLSQTLSHNIIFETLFFGIYYTKSRFKNIFNSEDQNEFDQQLITKLIWSLSNFYLASDTKDATAITKDMQEFFSIFLPPKLEEYSSFQKGNIGLKLKENLLKSFKDEGLSISEKTIDNYVSTVIKDFQEINMHNLLKEEGCYELD